ncbi:hypothetical protein GCM10011497_19830 [Elstera cyanobacteriorum]|uniref:DUF2249 domain-containing protein n=1 Tax=Elstera cyanobacteriorum TaxID=2022747 RepID=A0A255XQN8_9PROT|nr:DUF2249 domain-containing protein [Elstera cyanobacteriorum]OYQ19279.1 hypothetical protein CHR90_07505 [Elstera cyanobacteriorum]GFZ90263.1 hypothetical protein GCM10011497_19830 [Elstera cyanobacteriorum]
MLAALPQTVATLDLRTLPHPERHRLVFVQFAALQPGEAVELINDHDPLGLRHQFDQHVPGYFTWAYSESGPQDWRVVVGKTAVHTEAPAAKAQCGCGSNGAGGCG